MEKWLQRDAKIIMNYGLHIRIKGHHSWKCLFLQDFSKKDVQDGRETVTKGLPEDAKQSSRGHQWGSRRKQYIPMVKIPHICAIVILVLTAHESIEEHPKVQSASN